MSWFGPQHLDLPPLDPAPLFTTTATTYGGTLTFLGDGTVVIGCPMGTSREYAAEIAQQVDAWAKSPDRAKTTALVLPWPVDVTDLRPWMQPGDDA